MVSIIMKSIFVLWKVKFKIFRLDIWPLAGISVYAEFILCIYVRRGIRKRKGLFKWSELALETWAQKWNVYFDRSKEGRWPFTEKDNMLITRFSWWHKPWPSYANVLKKLRRFPWNPQRYKLIFLIEPPSISLTFVTHKNPA